MLTVVLEFLAIFAFILVAGYVLPAGSFYIRYYVRKTPEKEALRIQQRRPTRDQIKREVLLSLSTVAIFSVGATILFELYKPGHTAIYTNFHDYPLWYLPVSLVLCALAHDTYFYWTHRFMHWQPVFKYFHVGHHKSIAPTPWAIFAFQPLEAITQFIGIMAIVIFMPLHPLVILGFLWWDTIVNTAGHTGYEVVPKVVSRRPVMKLFNTVTHHDHHHTNMKVNFGSFFNMWDRLMGTFLSDEAEAPATVEAPGKPTVAEVARANKRGPREPWPDAGDSRPDRRSGTSAPALRESSAKVNS
jgi:lathosterol oxidase